MKTCNPAHCHAGNCCILAFLRPIFAEEEDPTAANVEEGRKFAAKCLIIDGGRTNRKVVIPTYEEWIGVNLLERDDEL